MRLTCGHPLTFYLSYFQKEKTFILSNFFFARIYIYLVFCCSLGLFFLLLLNNLWIFSDSWLSYSQHSVFKSVENWEIIAYAEEEKKFRRVYFCACSLYTSVVPAQRKLFFSFFFLVFLKSSGSCSRLLKILSTKLTAQSKYSGARTTRVLSHDKFN